MKRLLSILIVFSSARCLAQWTELGINLGIATSAMAPGNHGRPDAFVYQTGYRPLFTLAAGVRAVRTLDSVWQVGAALDIYELGYRGQKHVRTYMNGLPRFTTKHVVAPPLSSSLALAGRRWNGRRNYGYAGVALGYSWANSLVKTRGAIAGVQGGYKVALGKRWYGGAEVFARYSFLRFKDVSYILPDVDATLQTIHCGVSAEVSRMVGRR